MNIKYILEKIRIEGVLQDILAKSNGENVTVTYGGKEQTLSAALAAIFTSVTELPTAEGVDSKISAAISELIGGAPETYDTLKEIADYIDGHKDVADALTEAVGKKVDKVEGKGLNTEDFTTALKEKLEGLPESIAEATAEKAGLMSAADKARLDGIRGVRYGTEVPADMKDGELFIRVVSAAEET